MQLKSTSCEVNVHFSLSVVFLRRPTKSPTFPLVAEYDSTVEEDVSSIDRNVVIKNEEALHSHV